MLKLWGRANSSNVMKVLWLLDELSLRFERIDAGMAFGRNDTPEYVAMSPFGFVPALQDGSVALFESNAILRYVCNAHAPDSALYPREAGSRARVEAWMDAQLGTLAHPLGVVFLQLVRTMPEQRDDGLLAQMVARTGDMLAVVERNLASSAFLAGDTLTLADIAHGPLLHRWFALPVERPDLPDLRAYYDRLLERPAYVARCAGRLS